MRKASTQKSRSFNDFVTHDSEQADRRRNVPMIDHLDVEAIGWLQWLNNRVGDKLSEV